MKSEAKKRLLGAMVVAGIAALAAAPSVSHAADGRWRLRLAALAMDSNASSVKVVGSSGSGISVSTDVGGGIGIGAEYQMSRRLGVDLGVLLAADLGTRVDIGWSGVNVGTGITVRPFTAGLNVHLTPDSRFDLYLGPLLAYVVYDSFEVSVGRGVTQSISTENDLGFGANLGVDVHLGNGRHWSLVGNFKYIDTTLEATPAGSATGSTDFDPTIVGFGVGYRF
jgi:outer membrane protein W